LDCIFSNAFSERTEINTHYLYEEKKKLQANVKVCEESGPSWLAKGTIPTNAGMSVRYHLCLQSGALTDIHKI
jgi:hypothetical protein